jgi:hypothetical protein
MSICLKTILRSPLAIGACITAAVTITGTAYALMNPRPGSIDTSWLPLSKQASCKTVVFDPKPPLNVRSSPIEQAGNVINSLANGEEVSIVAEKDGWVQISTPVKGWIYQNLTKTMCGDSKPVTASLNNALPSIAPTGTERGSRILETATAHFQAGNLNGAIAIARTVPTESPAYPQAQVALETMPKTWNQAETQYENAKTALDDSRWHDVLAIATDFPDIRFWREKLTPVVKKAIQMQHILGQK